MTPHASDGMNDSVETNGTCSLNTTFNSVELAVSFIKNAVALNNLRLFLFATIYVSVSAHKTGGASLV